MEKSAPPWSVEPRRREQNMNTQGRSSACCGSEWPKAVALHFLTKIKLDEELVEAATFLADRDRDQILVEAAKQSRHVAQNLRSEVRRVHAICKNCVVVFSQQENITKNQQ